MPKQDADEALDAADSIKVPSLVTAEWLRHALATGEGAPVRVVDGSFKMPGVEPSARADYVAAHLPGAVFFDIDDFADTASPLPHMLPDPDKFSQRLGSLGLAASHHIVVYDTAGVLGAARVWWMLRTMGHPAVSVLDGGLKAWRSAGGAIDDLPPVVQAAHFTARPNLALVRDRQQMLANLATGRDQVVDARMPARFAGTAPEPWPGRRSGHIPGSLNVDHATLVDAATGALLPPAALAQRFAGAGVDLARPIVASCGSGVSACVLALALDRLGRPDVAVYDGSWAEWGLPDPPPGRAEPLPVELGPARATPG